MPESRGRCTGLPGDVGEVVAALRRGEAAVLPTDTVYGLAVSPLHAESPQLLYQIKGRPSDKPVAWLVGAREDLDAYGADVPEWARRLAGAFWPGALTLVVKAAPAVPAAYRSAEGTIGLRMPDAPLVREVARRLGGPLATTSANLSGDPAPHRFRDVDARLLSRVAAALDDGGQGSGIASTVVDCTGPALRILREGAITAGQIGRLLDSPQASGLRASGAREEGNIA